jgi:hypothetical protein
VDDRPGAVEEDGREVLTHGRGPFLGLVTRSAVRDP